MAKLTKLLTKLTHLTRHAHAVIEEAPLLGSIQRVHYYKRRVDLEITHLQEASVAYQATIRGD